MPLQVATGRGAGGARREREGRRKEPRWGRAAAGGEEGGTSSGKVGATGRSRDVGRGPGSGKGKAPGSPQPGPKSPSPHSAPREICASSQCRGPGR